MSFKEVYNSQRLIAEIKRRPGLYDPSSGMYSDKVERSKLWEEVCEAVVENWRMLDEGERIIKERDVQKRWKSLRDCFKRELLLQEKFRRSGMALNKKRKYLYFDSLSFLLPSNFRSRRNKNLKEDMKNGKSTESENIEMGTSNDSTVDEDNRGEKREMQNAIPSRVSKATNVNKCVENDLFYATNINHEREVIDDDKAFLVSLLPTLRKFNDNQKFKTRMLMMDVVRQVQLGHNPHLVTYSNEHVLNSTFNSNCAISVNPTKMENVDVKSEDEIKEEVIENDK